MKVKNYIIYITYDIVNTTDQNYLQRLLKKTTTKKEPWTMFVTKEEGTMDNVRDKKKPIYKNGLQP